jgi:periplasmic protein TonB
MFESFVGASKRKPSKWKAAAVVVSTVLHVAAVIALVVHSFWVIEKLSPPDRDLTFVVAAPPPPPPPPPPAGQRPKTQPEDKPKRVKPVDTVQPTERDEDDSDSSDDDDSADAGEEGGVVGGVAGGVVGGSLEGVPGGVLSGSGPPPPPPQQPQIVPQVALEQARIAGEQHIPPDDDVRLRIRRDGLSRVVTTVKMCLSNRGSPTVLEVVKSSGYRSYDQKILSKMREWRYRPFMVNNQAVPVCTSVTFIYNQR